jgi:hypothetical protein
MDSRLRTENPQQAPWLSTNPQPFSRNLVAKSEATHPLWKVNKSLFNRSHGQSPWTNLPMLMEVSKTRQYRSIQSAPIAASFRSPSAMGQPIHTNRRLNSTAGTVETALTPQMSIQPNGTQKPRSRSFEVTFEEYSSSIKESSRAGTRRR